MPRPKPAMPVMAEYGINRVSVVAAAESNAVDLACSLVEDVDDGWSVVVDYGVVLFLGFFLSHGSAFDDSWAGSVAAVR